MSFGIEGVNLLNMDYFFCFSFLLLFLVRFLLFCGKDIRTNKNAFIQHCKHKVICEVNCYFLSLSSLNLTESIEAECES